MIERTFGRDTAGDVLLLVSLFAGLLVSDRLLLRFASISSEGLSSPILLHQAAAENVIHLGLLVLGLGGVAVLGRSRILCRWDALEHGEVLRTIGAAAVLWLAWRASAYDFNYVLERWHGVDRVLVATLGLATVWRPVFLLPFVAQVRVINAQFSFPLGSAFGQVFDEMLLLMLIGVGVAYLLHAVNGRRQSSAVLLMWSTIVAAHLFEPGRAKLAMGWLQGNDVSLLAFNSYTAGWGGQGTGAYARNLGTLIAAAGWPVKMGTLVIEVGALVAVLHPRMFRMWLPMAATFHALTFALTGFFFFDWLAFELALCVVFTMPSLTTWVAENATPARAMMALIMVAFGARFYHAPGLAWLDAPAAYGYEVEAIGRSGQAYHVPLSAFAPFEQELTFARVNLSRDRRVTGGYGATSSPELVARLTALADVAELSGVERSFGPASPYPDPESEYLMRELLPACQSGCRSSGHPPQGAISVLVRPGRAVLSVRRTAGVTPGHPGRLADGGGGAAIPTNPGAGPHSRRGRRANTRAPREPPRALNGLRIHGGS